MTTINKLDSFTRAYVKCALWSSTLAPFGECPQCGKEAVLCRWSEAQECVCGECSDREPNYEPPADDNYSVEDLAPEALASMVADCEAFQRDNASDLEACGLSAERAGHDFWLTRNRHGSGFWDEGYRMGEGANKALRRLTEAAHAYGSCDLYVDDDGRIYL